MELTPQQILTIEGLLPEGWSQEPYNGDPSRSVIVISTPSGEHVTVCFDRRCWNLGYGVSRLSMGPGYNSKDKKYTGRSWCKQIITEAVAALNDIRDRK